MAEKKLHAIITIMVAFSFQGHITPFINLALKLASNGCTITFVHTEFVHHMLSKAHHGPSVEDVDLFSGARKSGLDIRYTMIYDGFPPDYDRILKFNEYWETILRDFPSRVDELVGNIILQSDDLVHFLVADTFYSWPATIAKKYNMLNVSFWTEPALVFSIDYHLDLLREKGYFPSRGNPGDIIDFIPGVQSIKSKDLMSYLQDVNITTTIHQIVIKAFEKTKMEDKLVMKPHAIMIALPYQGHLNPFVHLAIKLASKGFKITFVLTQHFHHQISKSHNNTITSSDEIDIFSGARNSGLDIRYTTISDGFPLEFDRNVNVGEFWESLFNDFPSRVDEFVGKIIESSDLSLSPIFLVTDTVYSWTGAIAKKYNLLNVSFWTEPAMVFAISYYLDLLRENGHFPLTDNHERTINYIPGIESISTKDLMAYFQESDDKKNVHKIVFLAFENVKNADFILHNTVQQLESLTLSALNQKHPTYAIGPINFSTDFTKINISKSMLSEIDCTKWLDSKPSGSVLYVSFGSSVQINKEVIEEIAQGLVLSEVNFIWAIRPQIVSYIDDTRVLPVGFEDDVKDRGLIVPWCNQNDVLSNRAVGGFLTHCGWNSILESIWCGVPMICYPVKYDQPTNRKLVVDDWKVGINLCDGVSLNREEVAKKIKKLMSGETSNGIKTEVKNIRSITHNALAKDGSSERNFDQFLKDLMEKM